MKSTKMKQLENNVDAEDKELEELRKSLANALVREEDVMRKIDQLEKEITLVKFNLLSQSPPELQKAISRFNAVHNSRKTTESEFVEHITKISELDALLSGIVFTAQILHGSPNGMHYILSIRAGTVLFFPKFEWREDLKSAKNIDVVIPKSLHKREMGSLVRTMERNDNLHKIIRVLTEYSIKSDEREKVLKEMEWKHAPYFHYWENDEEEGYKFDVSETIGSTVRRYFFATWRIRLYKMKNYMDHSFDFYIISGADALSVTHKDEFKLLTRTGPPDSIIDIRSLFGTLVQGFAKVRQTIPLMAIRPRPVKPSPGAEA